MSQGWNARTIRVLASEASTSSELEVADCVTYLHFANINNRLKKFRHNPTGKKKLVVAFCEI